MDQLTFDSFSAFRVRMESVAKESPTYEKLTDFIEKSYLQIIFMTAAEVAQETRISQGSVSRYCSSLGFRGYNDFLRSLQKLVGKEITAPQRFRYATKTKGHPLSGIIESEEQNLGELPAFLQGESYEALVDAVASSERLVLLSARMSATLLPYMKYILGKMRDNVVQAVPGTPEWDNIYLNPREKTTVVAIALPRYPAVLIEKLEYLGALGYRILVITDSRLSPAAKLAEHAVYVPITVSSIFDIYSTPMVLINLMLRDAAERIGHLEERLEQIEQYERANNVYYHLQERKEM